MSEERTTCPECGHENQVDARFCAECGSDLAIKLEGSEKTATPNVSHRKRDRFKIALLSTAVPVVGLSIVSSAVSGSDDGRPTAFGWGAAAGLWLIALVAGAGFGLARKHEIASGIVAGIGIGAIALAATCFANLRSF